MVDHKMHGLGSMLGVTMHLLKTLLLLWLIWEILASLLGLVGRLGGIAGLLIDLII